MKENVRQDERVAILTGGSSGLGKEIKRILLKNKWYVYDISRSQGKGAGEIGRSRNIQHDLLSSEKNLSSLYRKITHTKVDLLINNAGVAYEDSLHGAALLKDFKKIFKINFLSPIEIMGLFNKELYGGTVINISSDLSYFPIGNLSLYSASKSALNNYFCSIAERCPDTRILTIIPSMMDTPLLKKILGSSYAAFRAKALHPKDVADVILKVALDTGIQTGSEVFISHKAVPFKGRQRKKQRKFVSMTI